MTQPFALFDLEDGEMRAATLVPQRHPHEQRVVADSSDRVAWLRARSRGVTATDAAKLATAASVTTAANEKLYGTRGRGFGGSRFTDHGREREPVIASWVQREHGLAPSSLLFHAEAERRHLATPDGLRVGENGALELCEIKTTSKPWRGIPRSYLRQVWWQQYVLGAERTLVVWEQHDGFVPVGEPQCRWVDRDESQVAMLVRLANLLLEAIRPQPGTTEAVGYRESPERAFYRPGPLA